MRYLEHFRARATLMERLVDETPKQKREVPPLRVLDRQGLKDSVQRNLEWILNARTAINDREYEQEPLTVLEYGIPDLNHYSPQSHEDRQRLARRIKKAIEAFEPRLMDVKVEVNPAPQQEKTLRVIIIHAVMQEADIREPVIFKTILQD